MAEEEYRAWLLREIKKNPLIPLVEAIASCAETLGISEEQAEKALRKLMEKMI